MPFPYYVPSSAPLPPSTYPLTEIYGNSGQLARATKRQSTITFSCSTLGIWKVYDSLIHSCCCCCCSYCSYSLVLITVRCQFSTLHSLFNWVVNNGARTFVEFPLLPQLEHPLYNNIAEALLFVKHRLVHPCQFPKMRFPTQGTCNWLDRKLSECIGFKKESKLTIDNRGRRGKIQFRASYEGGKVVYRSITFNDKLNALLKASPSHVANTQ